MTNSPATFQAMMNKILRDLINKENLLTGSHQVTGKLPTIYVDYCSDPYIGEQVNKETGKHSIQFHARR